jgi:hypothetical protein
MPVWKFAPDSATTKITYPPILATVEARAGAFVLVVPPPLGAGEVGGIASPFNFSPLQMEHPEVIVTCKLTRGGGLPDLMVPVSYFNAELNSDGTQFVSVVIPDPETAGDVADMAGGNITIDKVTEGTGGARIVDNIADAPITAIRSDTGAKNQSISLQAVK